MDTPSTLDIESLFDHYFSHGCPCRFPRFRAIVALDLKEINAWDWDVSDVGALLEVFDRRVRLRIDSSDNYQTRGGCELCNAQVRRFGVPIFRDSFIERAQITPGELPDVGAAATWPVPICGFIFPAAPGNITRDERERVQGSYPRLSPGPWLAYMRELAEEPLPTPLNRSDEQ